MKELSERVASYVHLCTLYWWLRPFGCGVILGGYDKDGPQLYMIEPSGISYVSLCPFAHRDIYLMSSSFFILWILILQRYFGAAIGKGKQAAKT